MNMEEESALPKTLLSLGCQQENFPQTYIGLPLSNINLNLAAFTLLIGKVDCYLIGWQVSLLNHMGCVVLVNYALPTYATSALQLPICVIELIDDLEPSCGQGRRRLPKQGVLFTWSTCCLPKSHWRGGV
jgi:hypothetical protein